jgi:polar amino acid transport system permease protein
MGKLLHQFLNPLDLRRALPQIWDGFQTNIKLMVVAELLVLVFALLIAIVRGLPGRSTFPLRALAVAYTDFFRGTPLILVAYVLGFGIPALNLTYVSHRSLFTYGVVALTLVYTAYVTEVYRAGIESVHPSQRMAARSLGLTYGQTLRYVILPQAIRRVIPPLLNDFIGLQKDTALVGFVVAVPEAFKQASIDQQGDFNFTPLLCAAILFLIVTIPLTRLVDVLISRQRARRQGGTLL